MNRKRSFLYGSRAVALSLLAAVIVIAFNGLTAWLVQQYPQTKLDITPQRYYSVSKEAKAYLRAVDVPLKLMSLRCLAPDEVMQEMAMIAGTVERMAAQNSNITSEVFDLDQDEEATMEFIQKYAADPANEVSIFSVIVEGEDGSFGIVTPKLNETGYTLYPSYEDFEQRMINGIQQKIHGEDAEEITIPEKPSFNPALHLGVDPITQKVDTDRMMKQVKTLEILFVVVFPLVLFLVAILVFVLKRKK